MVDARVLLKNKIASGELTEKESALISLFFNMKRATKGLAGKSEENKTRALVQAVKMLHQYGTTFDTVTTDTALAVFADIRKVEDDRPIFRINYQRDLISTFKAALLYLSDQKCITIDEKTIRSVKTPGMAWDAKRAEDLLTKDEALKVIDGARNSRDRAMLSMMYDGAHRPAELRRLKWRDLISDEHGYGMRTKVKTGRERWIRYTFASTYITQWKNDYPTDIKPDGFVFVSMQRPYHQLSHPGIWTIVHKIADRVGNKKVKAGIFRPSKITHDVEDGFDQAYIAQKCWGNLSTQMMRVYAKPGPGYIDKVALGKAGMLTDKEKMPEKVAAPVTDRICPHCATKNPAAAKWCINCRGPLTEEARATRSDAESFVNVNIAKLPPGDREKFMDDLAERVARKMAAKN
ncbi:MAG: tyrosine-type recombinase/integrase [bacterium]